MKSKLIIISLVLLTSFVFIGILPITVGVTDAKATTES